MPGAQPHRSPVARVNASARRGANVPAGVPGVYRVPRRRVVTVQGDTGAAAAVDPNPWVQPDDVILTALPNRVGASMHEFYADPAEVIQNSSGTFESFGPDFYAVAAKQGTVGFWQLQVSVWFYDIGNLRDASVFVPSLPMGATGVEYENPTGELLLSEPMTISGSASSVVSLNSSGDVHSTWGAEILRYDRAGYSFVSSLPRIPDLAASPSSDPDVRNLYGLDVLASSATFPPPTPPASAPNATSTDTIPYSFDVVDGPDAEGWLAVMARLTADYPAVIADVGNTDYEYAQGFGFGHPEYEATFRPPRYRFTF